MYVVHYETRNMSSLNLQHDCCDVYDLYGMVWYRLFDCHENTKVPSLLAYKSV